MLMNTRTSRTGQMWPWEHPREGGLNEHRWSSPFNTAASANPRRFQQRADGDLEADAHVSAQTAEKTRSCKSKSPLLNDGSLKQVLSYQGGPDGAVSAWFGRWGQSSHNLSIQHLGVLIRLPFSFPSFFLNPLTPSRKMSVMFRFPVNLFVADISSIVTKIHLYLFLFHFTIFLCCLLSQCGTLKIREWIMFKSVWRHQY